MKIILVSRFPKDADNPRGGVETATVGLAKALASLEGNDVHVVTLEKSVKQPIVETHGRITVHRLKRSRLPMIIDVFNGPSSKRLRKYLYDLSPDIVHFHETWGFGSYYLRLPNVFTVHGFDSLNLPAEKRFGWRLRAKFWAWIERFAMSKQKHLISIAPYVREQIEVLTTAKIYDIWNSLNAKVFEVSRCEKFPTILFLGWLNSRKNPVALVKAVSLIHQDFPDLKVRLCGEASDPQYYDELKREIAGHQLQKIVELPGRVSQSEVKQELGRATVLVLPSFQENAPMVISEAMAAGVPVIASNLCGVPYMVRNRISGILINPESISEIGDAIKEVLSDSSLRRSLSENGKIDAREKFHPDSVADATMRCYKEVISSYG
ncbi:hypothetical protein NBRC116494_16680 [Aurantivibrio plasticivorans]